MTDPDAGDEARALKPEHKHIRLPWNLSRRARAALDMRSKLRMRKRMPFTSLTIVLASSSSGAKPDRLG